MLLVLLSGHDIEMYANVCLPLLAVWTVFAFIPIEVFPLSVWTAWAWIVSPPSIIIACTRDVNETLAYKTETKTFLPFQETEARPRHFCYKTRPRPCKAETKTFFETFNLQHCTKTMNGDVQIKTIYIWQYWSLTVSRTCIAINKQTCESLNNIDALHSKRCTCSFAMKQKAVHIGL